MTYLVPLLVASLLLAPHLARAASFTPLGDLPGNDFGSYAEAVSDDGSVVVGVATGSTLQAFRWSGGAMVGLGQLSPSGSEYGYGSTARDVSATGSVVVGDAYNGATEEAFRWTGGVMAGLGFLPGHSVSYASGVSADGEVVVGGSFDPDNTAPEQAFVWTGGTMTGLGFLPGGAYSAAYGVSADGSVIVGSAHDPAFDNGMAFRWENGVMSSLSDYPAGVVYSSANATSADGAFVVGGMGGPIGGEDWRDEAFRWSEGELLGLGLLSSLEFGGSWASDVSVDGLVVVGNAATEDNTNGAFVWTEADGMRALVDVLAANGATGFEGWNLQEISSVSADGQWVTGIGYNPDGNAEAFLANISVPGPSASWLLGSVLAALACARRRTAA